RVRTARLPAPQAIQANTLAGRGFVPMGLLQVPDSLDTGRERRLRRNSRRSVGCCALACGGQQKYGRQYRNQEGRMTCAVHRDLAVRPDVLKSAGDEVNCSGSLRLCRQRSTNQFLLIACKHMTVCISGRGPGDLPPSEGVKRAQQSRAADLLVALG